MKVVFQDPVGYGKSTPDATLTNCGMELDDALIGKEFVHFKGGRYRLVGYATDSETLKPMCVYEALCGEGGLRVRPAEMFFENVDKPGYSGSRFRIATTGG